MNFVPPGNPLDYYTDTPFRLSWARRTKAGRVCYFCGTTPGDSPVPCCPAADYWRQEMRARGAQMIWASVAREVS